MPIFRVDRRLVHFVHIPRCAGSSIEQYLIDRGAKAGFLDWRYRTSEQAWNRSSPQHVDGRSMKVIFPHDDFFDFTFAVVRHPLARFISAYSYHRAAIEDRLGKQTLEDFAQQLGDADYRWHRYFDNHFLPMSEHIVKNREIKIFKLESGLVPLKQWIDDHLFDSVTPAKISNKNSSKQGVPVESITGESLRLLQTYYHQDYQNFRYQLNKGDDVT